MNTQLLLFDLDGTLLRSDKTISQRTLDVLGRCREKGLLTGISTSRSEQNCLAFLSELDPDILIASGGAVVKYRGNYIYTAEFSVEETAGMIALSRAVCGGDCQITIDTVDHHYWNYKVDPLENDASWGKTIFTDYYGFHEQALKMCVEISNPDTARRLSALLPDCDCIRFSDGDWYKFTKKEATKENTILTLCRSSGISLENITAFGDDLVDIGMLKLCGTGVAMGNALDEVKRAADTVIGSNDDDGIAVYLTTHFLQ